MKKSAIIISFCLIAALALSACGGAEQTAATPKPAASVEPTVESTAEPTEAPAPAPDPTEEPDDTDWDALRATAETFIEKDVKGLIEAVGEPSATDYASSCLGPGEDGELTYGGFTVYTYKEGDSEIVKEVV